MKPVGIFYTTREGQTRRIARRVAGGLRARGFEVEVHDLRSCASDINLTRFSAAVLAASVHAGRHESEMVKFVKERVLQLAQVSAAFLSLTLSQAGAERPGAPVEERARFAADVQKMLEDFFQQTGWRPKYVKAVAGALLYSKYNMLVRFVMMRIAKKAGAPTDTSRDYEYTNWVSLDHFVDEFAHELGI